MWEKILAGIALIIIVGCMIYLIRRLKTRKERIATILSQLSAVFLLLLPALKPTSLPPDYVALHQPYLHSVLIVSQLKEGLFRVSYEITNLGKLSATEPHFAFVTSGKSGLDKSGIIPRTLMPQIPIVFEPNPLQFEIQRLQQNNDFILAIDYYAKVGDIARSFRYISRVRIRKDELKEGHYKPLSVVHTEGLFSDQELENLLGFRTLFKR
jgi:hypothetical protein